MDFFDFIILVVAPRKNRLRRYLKNGGQKQMFSILDKNQISPQKKVKYCDYLIVNNKSKKLLKKKVNDIITVQVISTDNKGLIVKPENCEIEFQIKKANIAVNSSDARPSRFVGGERIDAAIAELNFDKRKVSLSIKLLEELQNKEAVSKFSSPLSGKNLPFSSLSEKLSDKKDQDNE